MGAGTEDGVTGDRRRCLRLLTYGLYVVTVRARDEEGGFTANWLTQVSFEPPLLALSVQNDSRSIGLLRESGAFTVNLLPSGAREVAGIMGRRSRNVPDKLDRVDHAPGPSGRAVLTGALGYLECEVRSSVPAGDSTVFIAAVTGAKHIRDGSALTMAETGFQHSG